MEVVLVGVNHKTAPVETRERLAVLESHLPGTLEALRASGVVQEACIVSTCNRTEIYGLGESGGAVADQIVGTLASRHGMPRESLQPYLYHRFNEDAARHLYSVAAGLDSLIVGEGQILSQVREAYKQAADNRAVGPVTTRLFERAIKTGKRVRTETKIAQGASSVSAAAVELAKKVHGDLSTRNVLVLGTGKMGLLTVKLLVTAGVTRITMVSRTMERAQAALAQFPDATRGKPAQMDDLSSHLVDADIVVSCTGAPVPVISAATVTGILRRRRYRPLFIVDIAVPRDVESAVNDLENVFLYNVDDLSQVVAGNLAERQGEIDSARAIVEDEVQGFARYFASLETVPAIKRLRESFEETRAREVQALLSRGEMTPQEASRVEAFSRAFLNRLLHVPTTRIKDLATRRNVHEGLTFLMEIFDAGEARPASDGQPPQAATVSDQPEEETR